MVAVKQQAVQLRRGGKVSRKNQLKNARAKIKRNKKKEVLWNKVQWKISDFKLIKQLGHGQYGVVHQAQEVETKTVVALKMIKKKQLLEDGIERRSEEEVCLHQRLNHQNILKLLAHFSDDNYVYLVTECAKGDLFEKLLSCPQQRFDEPAAAKCVYQVADALHYCHEQGIIHRDLKPENVLLTEDGCVKLADFGWSAQALFFTRSTVCGTMDYTPPEIVEGRSYDKLIDNWGLGVLCYELLAGNPPFKSKTQEETNKKILKFKFKWNRWISDGAKDLISALLKLKASERLSLPEVMTHPWVVENKEKAESRRAK